MTFPSRQHRVSIELHGPEDVVWRYEQRQRPFGWIKMLPSQQRRLLTNKRCWEITLIVDRETGVDERVIDLKTPCSFDEVSQVIKQLIDVEYESGQTKIYYAKFIALVV